MGLWSDFLTNDQRPINKCIHYFPAYEQHFGRFVNTDVVFLEIGVAKGGSLQMWKRYFGPRCQIVGIDINPDCLALEEGQVSIRIGSQSDTSFLDKVCDEFGVPDVILDDGSHQMSDIHATFQHLYPKMQKSGVYCVEDLQTAYRSKLGGGLRKKSSFIESCKDMIDELNADHTRGELEPTALTRSTVSMHFYDAMVVFERGRHTKNRIVRTGFVSTTPAKTISNDDLGATVPVSANRGRGMKDRVREARRRGELKAVRQLLRESVEARNTLGAGTPEDGAQLNEVSRVRKVDNRVRVARRRELQAARRLAREGSEVKNTVGTGMPEDGVEQNVEVDISRAVDILPEKRSPAKKPAVKKSAARKAPAKKAAKTKVLKVATE